MRMIKWKYFKGIREAQKKQGPVPATPPFDIERLRKKGLSARIAKFLMEDHPRWWLALLRRFHPNLALGRRFLLVTKGVDEPYRIHAELAARVEAVPPEPEQPRSQRDQRNAVRSILSHTPFSHV